MVRIAGVATGVHIVRVVVVCTVNTLVIDINHVQERFLKVIFSNYQSTFVALYWVFNRVYSRYGCWWASGRWPSIVVTK